MQSIINYILSIIFVIFMSGFPDAGKNQSVNSGATVTLDGSASKTPPSGIEILSYKWEQVNGPSVSINFSNSKIATFKAPTVTKKTKLMFRLTGTVKSALGIRKSSDNVTITVLPKTSSIPPVAKMDVNVSEISIDQPVALSASNSTDDDGTIVSYEWYDESNNLIGSSKDITYTFTTVGTHNITLKVKDNDNLESNVTGTFNIKPKLLSIALTPSNPLTLEFNATEQMSATATYSDNTTQDVTLRAHWSSADSSIASIDTAGLIKGVGAGDTSIKATINGISSPSLNITVKPPVVLQSITVTPTPIHLRVNQSVTLQIEGHYSNGTTKPLNDVEYILEDYDIASISSSGEIKALEEGSTTLIVKQGNIQTQPIEVVTAKEIDTSNIDFTSFGSGYTNTIPIDATKEKYDEKRFCMIAGQINAEDGTPLSNVKVTIIDHLEYGSVITNSDGTYAIPAEGGLQLTMRYTKDGYTTIDRKVDAPVQDWVRAPEVTMLKVDSKVTAIDLTNANPQTHISTAVTDDRGTRSTTLVFDGVTKATVTNKDGSTQELENINVRATEFKTPESMPSDLPKETAYTYCSDLKVDGVGDDANVTFDAPVIMYVDNFLDFKVGEIVPIGYYDRNAGVWKGSDNGVVVRLLDTNNDGKVDALDSTGDNQPDDLNHNGTFEDEVAGISLNSSYSAGKTYWRAAITHFTPWDHNWPYGPPDDATDPDNPDTDDNNPDDTCKIPINSYVEPKKQVYHEDIPIAGTDISLHYASNRVEGYRYTIDVGSSLTTLPASLKQVIIKLEVGGREFTKTYSPSEAHKATFDWDGKDILGRPMVGEVKAKASIGFMYGLVYYSASSSTFTRAWARVGTGVATGAGNIGVINGRQDMISWRYKTIDIHAQSTNIKNGIGNGWSLTPHHMAFGNLIVRGDGDNVEQSEIVGNNIITTIAGNGTRGYSGDGGLATQASINYPFNVALDNLGNIYISDLHGDRIFKINKEGIIGIYAGNGTSGYSGDGGLATQAQLDAPRGLAVDDKRNLYISDSGNSRIRKVDTNGIITTIAGNKKAKDYIGDNNLAIDAYFGTPTEITFDNFGNLYIADVYMNRIRKIDTNGIITTVAGTGDWRYGGDGGLATKTSIGYPHGVAVDYKGNIYISSRDSNRVLKVNTKGTITTYAGTGESGYSGDGGLATQAKIWIPEELTVDKQGNLYISEGYNIRRVDTNGFIKTIINSDKADGTLTQLSGTAIDIFGNLYYVNYGNSRIRKISPSPLFTSYSLDSSMKLYKNPDNTGEVFDATGRHIKTIDLSSGNALKTFGYDDNGRLISITDQFDQITTITRDTNGNPALITAPNGQQTYIETNSNGDITAVRYEDASKYTFEYDSNSLMTKEVTPNGYSTLHTFDDKGRITQDIDAGNGSWLFNKFKADKTTTYTMTKPEGEAIQTADTVASDGSVSSLMSLPSGDTISTLTSFDQKTITNQRDGVISKYIYGSDLTTGQKTLTSLEVTQPSGLKQTTAYNHSYVFEDGTSNSKTLSKTSTVSTNGKISKMVSDYVNGTETLSTPLGKVAKRVYDLDTLLTQSVAFGSLSPMLYEYDSKGRAVQETTGTRETSYTYDSKGNVASITDPRGKVTTMSYDLLDRLVSTTHPDGTMESYTYDANGNTVKLITPKPSEHTFAYNGTDNRINMTSPLGKSTQYVYDKNRRVTSILKPSGKSIQNSYSQDRLISTTTPEDTFVYSYLFGDKVGSITKGSESINYTYDGNLLTSINQTGALNSSIAYTYNNDFKVSSMTYANASSTYTYDNDGQLTQSGAYTITRDSNALATSITDGTLTQSRGYNTYGELTTLNDNVFGYTLNRDNIGAISTKQESLKGINTSYEYIYDDKARLTKVTKNGNEVESYTYDNNGNRVSATVNGVTSSASYTLDDQIQVYGNNTYTYDDDGYLVQKATSDGTHNYTYGSLGELRSVTTPTANIEYLYNANNQRVAKKVNGTIVEKYLWANLTTLLAIYDKDDNLIQRFEYSDGRMPTAMTQNNTKYYLHYDQVGSLRAVSDTSGNIIKEITYDTYGNILTDTNANFKVPFGFAGGLYDSDTKLTRFGYRDYDSYTGKWTAKDPIDFAGGDTNLYGYVLGDPVNFMDAMGLIVYPSPNGIVPGGPWIPNQGNRLGNYLGPKLPTGGRAQCQYVPSEANGGPSGALESYWKTQYPGEGWGQRYDMNGKPITPDEAHSGNNRSRIPFANPWWLFFLPTPAY